MSPARRSRRQVACFDQGRSRRLGSAAGASLRLRLRRPGRLLGRSNAPAGRSGPVDQDPEPQRGVFPVPARTGSVAVGCAGELATAISGERDSIFTTPSSIQAPAEVTSMWFDLSLCSVEEANQGRRRS